MLQFDTFELEDLDEGECHDWVKANGAEYCGDTLPDPILSDDKIMTVGFHSDKSVEKKGFKANVYEGISYMHCWTLQPHFIFL